MFERLSEQGRQVVVFAQDEARSLGHDYIGSEHILLGLLRQDDDLVELLGDPAELRMRVVEIVGYGDSQEVDQRRFTPNAATVLKQAARQPGSSQVGPPQLALALLELPAGAAASKALRAHGVSTEAVRDEILLLGAELLVSEQPADLSAASRRVLETAARHADDDAPLGPEHLLLALVLEVPDLMLTAIGTADGGVVHERLADLLEGPVPSPARAPRRDIAVLEAALRHAERAGSTEVLPVQILLGLLEAAPDVVARAAIDLAAVGERARRFG